MACHDMPQIVAEIIDMKQRHIMPAVHPRPLLKPAVTPPHLLFCLAHNVLLKGPPAVFVHAVDEGRPEHHHHCQELHTLRGGQPTDSQRKTLSYSSSSSSSTTASSSSSSASSDRHNSAMMSVLICPPSSCQHRQWKPSGDGQVCHNGGQVCSTPTSLSPASPPPAPHP
jgi:hypothetical protein